MNDIYPHREATYTLFYIFSYYKSLIMNLLKNLLTSVKRQLCVVPLWWPVGIMALWLTHTPVQQAREKCSILYLYFPVYSVFLFIFCELQ